MKKKLNLRKSKIVKIVAVSLAIVTVVGFSASLFKPASVGGGSGGGSSTVKGPVYGQRAEDYAQLYVQDGLVGNYMAYDRTSLKLEEDTTYFWKNHVKGGESAKFTNASTWRSMDGGIGYRWYHDQENRPVGALEVPGIDDGISVYTVEVACKFLGVTDRDTGRMLDIGETETEDYFQQNTIFRFGDVHAVGYLSRSSNSDKDRSLRWYSSKESYLTHGDNSRIFTTMFPDNVQPDLNAVRLSYSMSPTSVDEFSFQVDLACGYENTYQNSGNVEFDYQGYTDTVSEDAITLFNGYPCVIYAVRIYDGADFGGKDSLTNAFVDMLAYYKINVSSILNLDEDVRNRFLRNCGEDAQTRGLVFGNPDSNETTRNRTALMDIIRTNWPE